MADLPAGFAVDPLQSFGRKVDDGEDEKRDRSRPFVGGAIEEGRVRFLSVSQLKLWDHTQFGGCKRRYAFKYKFRIKISDETESTKSGREEYAKGLEDYYVSGEDALVPVLRAAKHLFPKPGPDIESERPLGDYGAAVTLRDAVLFGGAPDRWDRHFRQKLDRVDYKIEKAAKECDTERLKGLVVERKWIVDAASFVAALPPENRSIATQNEIQRLAGLTANGIPLDGAADIRHRRQEYINNYGILTREDADKVVVEVADLKSTKQISDRTNRKTGEIYKGYAKTVEQVLDDPQMIGYGVHAADLYRDATHVRLTHIYVQTKPPLHGERRTGLITVDEVRQKWRRVDGLASEIEEAVANTTTPEEFPYNPASCNSYNRPCPFEALCKRPEMTIMDALQLRQPGEEKSMSNGLFDLVGGLPPPPNGTNGAAASVGLFGSVGEVPPPTTALPPPPVQSDAERAAAIEAAKAALLQESKFIDGIEGYPKGMGCNGLGYYVNQDHGGGHAAVEVGHVHNANCKIAPQQVPAIGQVNPPDQPPRDPIAESSPLTPEQIAGIVDPEIRSRAEEHARQHALRVAADEAAKPKTEKKTGGRCPLAGQKMQLTVKEAAQRPIKKLCTCGKEHKVKPDSITFEGDTPFFVVPSHNIPKTETTDVAPAAAATSASAQTELPVSTTSMQELVAMIPPPPPTVAVSFMPPIVNPPLPSSVATLPLAPSALPPPPTLTSELPASPAIGADTVLFVAVFLTVQDAAGGSHKIELRLPTALLK